MERFIIQEGLYDPGIFKAFFLAGGPGSGKTYVNQRITPGLGLKNVNSDTAFENALKRAGLSLDMPPSEEEKRDIVRARAKKLTTNQLSLYIRNKLGLVIDSTARDYVKMEVAKAALTRNGYESWCIFVNTSLDVALARNAARDRTVPTDIVKKSHAEIQQNMGKLQRLFGSNNFIIVDNNKVAEDVNPAVHKAIRRMITKKPTSYQAVSWIKRELQKRKRA